MYAVFLFIVLFILHKSVKESQQYGALIKSCLQAILSITGIFIHLNQKIIFLLRAICISSPVTINEPPKREKKLKKIIEL